MFIVKKITKYYKNNIFYICESNYGDYYYIKTNSPEVGDGIYADEETIVGEVVSVENDGTFTTNLPSYQNPFKMTDMTETFGVVEVTKEDDYDYTESQSKTYALTRRYVKHKVGEFKPDYTVVGSPTITNDGIASGFTTGNYLLTPSSINLNTVNSFEIVIRAKQGGGSLLQQHSNNPYTIALECRKMLVRLNGSSAWTIVYENDTGLVEGNWYSIRATFDGSKYKFERAEDGGKYVVLATLENSTKIISNNQPFILGINDVHTDPFKGSIDLSQSYIKINGQYWWTGFYTKNVIGGKYYLPVRRGYRYFKEVEENWTQPTLGSNGTVGGSSYAVRVSSQNNYDGFYGYKAFDSNNGTIWEADARNNSQWIEFYSPVQLKVSSVNFVNRGGSSTTYSVWKLTASNDGTNYTTIKEFNVGSSGDGASWTITFNIDKPYKYFRFSAGNGAAHWGNGDCKVAFATIKFNAKEFKVVEGTPSDYTYKEDKLIYY